VTYSRDGATGGTVPVDSTTYAQGSSVRVLGNTGGLLKVGYSFVGWQTESDGSGTTYTGGQTFSMGAANVTLYALWSGGNAYVADYAAHTVSQYTIGPNGALTPMSPATVPAGNGPWSVTVDAGHRYAYVANFSGTDISQYTIDPSSGALTPMSPATVAAGTPGAYANSVAVDPSGRYAYAVTQTDGTISQYTIGSNGALTLKASTAVLPRSYPDSIAIDPSGKYAYVSNLRADPTPGDPNYNQYTVAQFTIDAASGALTQMNPETVRAESGPRSVVVDPTGGRVYAVCFDHGQVSQYAIGPGGALTPLSPATVAAGGEAISIAVDPSGRYVFVANSGAATEDISQYTIGPGGALTPLSPPMAVAGSGSNSIAVNPSGRYAYVTNSTGNTVSQFTIGPSGTLTPMSSPTVPAPGGPTAITTIRR